MAMENSDLDLWGESPAIEALNTAVTPAERAEAATDVDIPADDESTIPATVQFAMRATNKGRYNLLGESGPILSPFDGSAVERTDIDRLIDLYEQVHEVDSKLMAVKGEIRKALFELTEGDAATRRLRGQRRACEISLAPHKFDPRTLKVLWENYPDLRDEALRIEAIGVKMREYQKLVNTSGTKEFNAFRDALTGCYQGRPGLPTIKVTV